MADSKNKPGTIPGKKGSPTLILSDDALFEEVWRMLGWNRGR